MTYQLVFDSATANYEGWVFLPFGLLFVVIGCVLVFDRDFLADITPIWWRAVISWFFLLVSVVCTVLVTWGTVSDYFELRIASRNNTCTLVSGVVSEFRDDPQVAEQLPKASAWTACRSRSVTDKSVVVFIKQPPKAVRCERACL